MSLQTLDTGLVLIIPDLDLSVIGPCDEVGLVPSVVVVHAVHAFLVALKGEVGSGGAQLPDLDSPG